MRLLLLLAIAATAFAQDVRLPNSKLTPGATTGATATALCNKKFHTADVRNVPESEKKAVYAEYGVENHKGYCSGAEGCEVDHLISLELGGSNDIKNLWPQPYGEHPGAHEKDKLENWLHRQVCAKQMSLDAAQKAISGNWFVAYRRMLASQVKNKQSTPICPGCGVSVQLTTDPPEAPDMPRNLTINGDRWLLLKVTHLSDGDVGRTNCQTKTILLIGGLKAQDVVDTILHEWMHAVSCSGGEPNDVLWNNTGNPEDPDQGHTGIYWGAGKFMELIVDNPELIKYLQVQGR